MAPQADAKILFCILFLTCCFTVTLGQIPLDCCLSVKNRTIAKFFVTDYHPQAKGCSVDATILVTRKARKLCVPVNEKWVEELKKYVDGLKKKCKTKKTNSVPE